MDSIWDMKTYYLSRFSKDLHENKHVARAALRRDPRWLPDSPASVKNDLESVLVALSHDNFGLGGHLFEHASPKLRATKSAVIAAVEIQPYSLFYASKELQADVDVNIPTDSVGFQNNCVTIKTLYSQP